MGNYGRWDRYVEAADPYGTNGKIDAINQIRSFREGQMAAQRARPSITDINEARRQALYDQDLQNEMRSKQDMVDRGENDYEQSLDKRGLLNTDIDYDTTGDDGRAHPATLHARGKVDPATAALLKEAAGQGLIGGQSAWTNTAESRAALAALMQSKKDEALQQQARQDALDRADQTRADATARAQIPVQLQSAQFAHEKEMLGARAQASAADPDAQSRRRLMAIQEQGAEEQLKAGALDRQRSQDEYLTPQQRMAQMQGQALLARAQTGDPEAYHALTLLGADPKLGINTEAARPGIDRVLSQPQIKGELDALGAAVEAAGYSPDEEAIARVKHHAARAVQAAADFGPDVQAEVARIVKEHIQHPSTAGSLAGAWAIPGLGAIRAGYRYLHRNDAQNAFADLTGSQE